MTDHKIAAVKFHVEGDSGVTYGAIAIDNNGPITPEEVKKIFKNMREELISKERPVKLEFKVIPETSMSSTDCKQQELPFADSTDKVKEIIESKAEDLRKLKP